MQASIIPTLIDVDNNFLNFVVKFRQIPSDDTVISMKVSLDEKELVFYNEWRKNLSTFAHLPLETSSEWGGLLKTQNDKGSRLFSDFLQITQDLEKPDGGYLFTVSDAIKGFPWEHLYSKKFGYLDRIKYPVIRQLNDYSSEPTFIHDPSILFVGSDPETFESTRSRKIYHELQEILNSNHVSSQILKDEKEANTPQFKTRLTQLERVKVAVKKLQPSIVHVVAHGLLDERDSFRGFRFEGADEGSHEIVSIESLFQVLDQSDSLRIVFLGSCNSGVLFEESKERIFLANELSNLKAVICMAAHISVPCLMSFTQNFYQALLLQLNVSNAVAYARSSLQDDKKLYLQRSIPMIYESSPINVFNNIISRTKKYSTSWPIKVDIIRAIDDSASLLKEVGHELNEVYSQNRPSESEIVYINSSLRDSVYALEMALESFEEIHYSQSDRSLIYELRIQCGKSLNIIHQFLKGYSIVSFTDVLEEIKSINDRSSSFIAIAELKIGI